MNGQLYVVPELTTTFQQWTNKAQDYISQFILPDVPVENIERFLVWSGGNEHLIVPTNTLRTGQTKYARSTFSQMTGEKGPLEEHGLAADLTDRQYRLSPNLGGMGLETRVTEGLASRMRLLDEKSIADTFADTGTISQFTPLSGSSQWDNGANSDPLKDIKDAVLEQRKHSPNAANTAFLSWDVWMKGIVMHPTIISKINFTEFSGMITQAQFLALLAPLGITKLYIGSSRRNSANEGQDANIVDVWGNHFWVGYVTDEPGQFEINGGYRFNGGPAVRQVFKETHMDPPGSTLVTSDFYDYIFLSTDVYFMIQNAVSNS